MSENMRDREKAWGLLSDLYVDTTYSEAEIVRLAEAIKSLNYSISELEHMFKNEVGPVAGRWMCRGMLGPWPIFDLESLTEEIIENMNRPWYKRKRRCLGAILGTRRDWKVLTAYLQKNAARI
jgi:hypothetical protein